MLKKHVLVKEDFKQKSLRGECERVLSAIELTSR